MHYDLFLTWKPNNTELGIDMETKWNQSALAEGWSPCNAAMLARYTLTQSLLYSVDEHTNKINMFLLREFAVDNALIYWG